MNRFLHLVAGGFLVALMLLTVADVISRWLFSQPFGWTVEVTELAMVLVVYLALGHAEHEGDHISIDLVYNHMPARLQKASFALATTAGIIVTAFLAWALIDYSGVLASGGYVTSVLGIPLRPLALGAAVASILFCLSMVVTLAKGTRSHGGTE